MSNKCVTCLLTWIPTKIPCQYRCSSFAVESLSLLNRVTIDELQKHTELDTDRENDFTVEEVRVSNAHSMDVHRTLLDLDDSRR